VRASPVMNGVPSPLQYNAGASLPPGTYNLKLAVAEGDRVGSIEHEIHAGLPNGGGLAFSELMAGGPHDAGQLLTPTIGYTVTFGMLHGYVEVYGARAPGVTAEYEVAATADAPALINLDAPPYPAGDERVIFSTKLQVNQLPPGKYVLRAIFSEQGKAVKTLTRPFEIAPPKVLMTSAEGLGAVSVDSELFLPVDEAALAGPFKRDDAIKPELADKADVEIRPSDHVENCGAVIGNDREGDLGVAVIRDLDALHGADRDTADLYRVALDELAGVQEAGMDPVAAPDASVEQDQGYKHDRSDDRTDGGDASDSAQRSHLPLLLSHQPQPLALPMARLPSREPSSAVNSYIRKRTDALVLALLPV